MVFSSLIFLYFFLPVAVGACLIAPAGKRNLILCICSLFFYFWGEQAFVLLLAGEILLAYIFSKFIVKFRNKPAAKLICMISVMIPLLFLIYFKYGELFHLSSKAVVLPAGISFFTFQIISYTVDIYKNDAEPADFTSLAAYISMFPQLIAGPIVRYSDISVQLKNRSYSISSFSEGIRRFVIGLGKKVLIANQLAELCDFIKYSEEPSVFACLTYGVIYGLFVYYDFSGYSDMAIGLGKTLGFHFRENFNYPFISSSITEFWQRWHISLGSWFRDYVYIPLGGNRKGIKRQLVNIFAVWALTGLWHGAGWNFLWWGIYFAVLLCIEKAGLLSWLKKHAVFAHLYVVITVTAGFLIFDSFTLIKDIGNMPFMTDETLYYYSSYFFILILSIAGATPFIKNAALNIPEKIRNAAEVIFIPAVLILVTASLADGAFNPFLYFRF